MLVTFIRAIVLYILVLIVMRLMGKREIRATSAIRTCNINYDCRSCNYSNVRTWNSYN